ncbi:MFS transporter [Thioclava sp. SK-1]|nr:MFS transporter [Thioclava sp. SK-1]
MMPGVQAPTSPLSAKLVILALALGGFAIGTTEFAAMALLPYFAQDFGVTEARAADAISAYALGVVIGAPSLAILGAKMKRRVLLVSLMLAFAVFNGLSALAPGYNSFLVMRFLSGLPHGAYFGVAALVIAAAVPPGKRSSAVAKMFLGLTVATTLGVPLANYLAQFLGWRSGFGIVAILGLMTAIAVYIVAPRVPADPNASPLKELGALKNRQVWLTLLTGAIGFSGFFAVYTYLASTMTQSMGLSPNLVPWMLMLVGLGMTVFTLVFGWTTDRNQTGTALFSLIVGAIILMLYPVSTGSLQTYVPLVFTLGIVGGISLPLQIRLMDVAGDSQQLAQALHHAGFNLGNAIGPFLAARAIAAGHDFPVSGYVGAIMSLIGLALFLITLADRRRSLRMMPV